MNNLSKVSNDYIENTNIEHRKKLGQYFTPKNIRDILIQKLPQKNNADILEPSCGSGEFITSIIESFNNPKIDAIEFDKNLFNICKEQFSQIKLYNENTLIKIFNKKYDFIIGNPPYFEMELTPEIKDKYCDVIYGRTNIYSLFIKLGLDLLKDNGYLAYVIPTSMNNGAYFSKLREYIVANAEIEDIIMFDDDQFKDAQQNVMILILKKKKNTGKFVFKKNGIMIFSKKYKELNEFFDNKKTLKELGFAVKTGGLVWNQNKNLLTDLLYSERDKAFQDGYSTLIWAHNIVDNKIKLDNSSKKKQYIRLKNKAEKKNAIVVNRITGAGKNARIRAAIVSLEYEWYGENHINIIYKPNKDDVDIELLQKIHKQLISKDTLKIIKLITGNTQLSKNELENLIPIKL